MGEETHHSRTLREEPIMRALLHKVQEVLVFLFCKRDRKKRVSAVNKLLKSSTRFLFLEVLAAREYRSHSLHDMLLLTTLCFPLIP